MSSQKQTRRRAHDGKIAYATKREAFEALFDIRHNHPNWGHMLPYRCRFCPAYHIGHPPKQRKPKQRVIRKRKRR